MTVFSYLMLIEHYLSQDFYDFNFSIFSSIVVLNDRIHQTLQTVCYHISKPNTVHDTL